MWCSSPTSSTCARVAPIELTGRLLFPLWQYGPGEEDMTLFFCEADGVKDGAPVQARWIMLDRYDRAGGVSSMAMSADAGEEIVATLGKSSANSSDQRATGEHQERERIRSTSGGRTQAGGGARRGIRLEQVG